MPTSIIFDSNCFWDNYNLDNPIFSTTLKFCSNSEDYQFALPQIIKYEVKNNYRKQLRKRFDRIRGDLDWYNKHTSQEEEFLNEDEFEKDLAEYDQKLNRIIREYFIEELEYPEEPHQLLVERNIYNQKPFSDNDSGYKDTLIWLNILDHLQSTANNVIFVSNNSSDFGKNDRLHKDLLNELESLGVKNDRIQYFNTTKTFFDEIVKPQLHVLEAIDQIRNNEYANFNFYEYIDNNIIEWLIESQDEIDLSYISSSLQRPVIDMVDQVELIELSDGNRIDDNEILLEYDIGVSANCDVLIDRHMPPNEHLAEAIHIFNFKFNPSFMEGEVFLHLGARLVLIFDPVNNNVLTTQLENIVAQDYY